MLKCNFENFETQKQQTFMEIWWIATFPQNCKLIHLIVLRKQGYGLRTYKGRHKTDARSTTKALLTYQLDDVFYLRRVTICWGIPSSMGLPTFFFLLLLLPFPPPDMAFSDTKHNEGNLALTWYLRKTFL